MMFAMAQALPLSVEFKQGETAASLASRLTRKNGAPRVITFSSDVGLTYLGITNGEPDDVVRLASLAGCSAVDLRHGTPQLTSPGWLQLGAETIKFTAFNRTALKACPECLREATKSTDAAHFGVWQLTSVRTCKRHGCYLVPMPKARSNKDTFDFMHLCDQYDPILSEPANESDLKLENYLRDRIENGPGSSWLDKLPFHVAAQTCEGFGLLLTQGASFKRDDATPAQWARAGSAGFDVLRKGPDAVRRKLKEIQEAHPVDNTLYRTRYRVFFEWLRHRDDDPAFDVIRDLVRDFIFKNFPIAEGAIVLGRPCPEQYVHSLSTARSRYGVSGWQLARRLEAMGLATRNTSGRGFVLKRYVSTEVINDIVTDSDALLNAGETASKLGIERFMLTKLTNAGLISKYFADKNAYPHYHPREIERFLAVLRDLIAAKVSGKAYLDIPSASHRLRIPTERVVEIILRNRIALAASDPDAVQFPEFQVALEDLKEIIARDHEGTIRPARAAEILGLNIRTIRGLLDQNFLKPKQVTELQTGRKRRYVCAKSMERFRERYISVVELSNQSGRLPGAEAVIRLDQGLKPLPLGTRCRLIFRRDDVL
ncbi:TniQ protein [Epibacterium ulvae]|uniref:TniQ protein n=1 Tax=Epibacterium ulvae TaxID=1156985 RepID=A0A1G5RFG9_9RHOB|nr:TniQ family protein [Epibacterium ulvae]SCZ72803.1 TniQ protein [Epibacterium ulvae]